MVYPCGTEIGLEIYRSLNKSIHFEIIGGPSTYDHGRFVYKNHIDNLPFISDLSAEQDILEFNKIIEHYKIDFIYPAMDGVLTIFARYRHLLKPIVIAPSAITAEITCSKRKTYDPLRGLIPVPEIFDTDDCNNKFPVFVKPDRGQGAVGAMKIESLDELSRIKAENTVILEYLPGKEYTVDCFTNELGQLIYARARGRKRIKSGISVNEVFEDDSVFKQYA